MSKFSSSKVFESPKERYSSMPAGLIIFQTFFLRLPRWRLFLVMALLGFRYRERYSVCFQCFMFLFSMEREKIVLSPFSLFSCPVFWSDLEHLWQLVSPSFNEPTSVNFLKWVSKWHKIGPISSLLCVIYDHSEIRHTLKLNSPPFSLRRRAFFISNGWKDT